MMIDDKPRCGWMGDDELMLRYHDEEWGEKNYRKRSENDRGQVFILHIERSGSSLHSSHCA